MARDIAQQELDQGGFRISNLGNPTSPGDATKTDNTVVPLPSSGSGAAGQSLFAAPIDHVHPASSGGDASAATFVRLTDPRLQAVDAADDAPDVIFDDVVDFGLLPGTKFLVTASAEMVLQIPADHGKLEVRLDGDTGDGNRGVVLATLETTATKFRREETQPSAPFEKPAGRHRITIAARGGFLVREKEVVFKSAP